MCAHLRAAQGEGRARQSDGALEVGGFGVAFTKQTPWGAPGRQSEGVLDRKSVV